MRPVNPDHISGIEMCFCCMDPRNWPVHDVDYLPKTVLTAELSEFDDVVCYYITFRFLDLILKSYVGGYISGTQE